MRCWLADIVAGADTQLRTASWVVARDICTEGIAFKIIHRSKIMLSHPLNWNCKVCNAAKWGTHEIEEYKLVSPANQSRGERHN